VAADRYRAGFDRGLTRPRSSDGDPAAQNLHERQAAEHGWRRRGVRRRYGSERRRCGGLGAGVHHSTRGLHRNDQRRMANTTATSRSGEDGAGRRTAEKRSGGAPVRTTRRHDAWGRLQAVQAAPLPSGGGTETAARRRETAEARFDCGGADELGFVATEAKLGFWSSRGSAVQCLK
jgi:hypothetical protein